MQDTFALTRRRPARRARSTSPVWHISGGSDRGLSCDRRSRRRDGRARWMRALVGSPGGLWQGNLLARYHIWSLRIHHSGCSARRRMLVIHILVRFCTGNLKFERAYCCYNYSLDGLLLGRSLSYSRSSEPQGRPSLQRTNKMANNQLLLS